MAIRLYGDVKTAGPVDEAELVARLHQLALCCRGLEMIASDISGVPETVAGRVASLAGRLATQSERLAGALAAAHNEPEKQ
jgi:hypothetical protein